MIGRSAACARQNEPDRRKFGRRFHRRMALLAGWRGAEDDGDRRPMERRRPPCRKTRWARHFRNGRGERIRTSGPLPYGPCAARAPRLRLAPRPAPGFRPQGRPGFAVPRRLRRPPEVRTSHPNQKDPVTDVTRSIYGRGERIRTSGPLLPNYRCWSIPGGSSGSSVHRGAWRGTGEHWFATHG